jgi:pyruvate, water dikinase
MIKTKFVKNFKELNKKSVNIAGGKGASLGEMTAAKISVPPGFVVLAPAFDRFLEETDLFQDIAAKLKTVKYDDVNSVTKISVEIHDLILDATMPADIAKEIISDFKKLKAKFVAVRSSATAEDSAVASWAGELESYLNTTEKGLLENVKKCWASLFTPRAIFYRQEKGLLDSKVSVAVVIQKMVDSDISGIVFTVHPVTEDRNQMIIEAGFGLGEAIVSGSITPDSYVLSKKDLSLMDVNIAQQERKLVKDLKKRIKWEKVLKAVQEKQKLSNKEIFALAKICLGIEKHYKFPCDIEWAFEKNKFYIVQSRPITTLK